MGIRSQAQRSAILALLTVVACSGENRTVTGPDPKPVEKVYTIAAVSGLNQRAPAGELLPLPITVQIKDEAGKPAPGLSVEFVISIGGGSVSASAVTTDANGTASVNWTLGWAVGIQTLWAHYGSTSSASLFMNADALVNPRSDVAIVRNTPSLNATVLLRGADLIADGRRVTLPDSVVYLAQYDALDTTAPTSIFGFSLGVPPVLARPGWSAGPDTIAVAFKQAFKIPLTIYVMENFEQNAAVARRDVDKVTVFWRSNPWGLEMGEVRIIDATQIVASPISCVTQGVAPDPSAITIYYAQNAQIGSSGGYSCSSRVILMKPQSSGLNSQLLAHEIGHSFGLGHVVDASNFMHPTAVNGGANTGQIFNAHFSPFSAINNVYHLRPTSELNACCMDDRFQF